MIFLCKKENREEKIPVNGFGTIRIGDKKCEKAVAEITKTNMSESHVQAYLQHKCGEH